ncbi:uncharacterized protein LOC129939118 [Eupeodes corollae]|uniref:uncharacterized protein LOC129939118 n=1 Tax=Eupeodes corollae TaxID=290404 RepID=UPI002493C837|nr:uncharacterized protein LOC129939118 [Eupeodes corollae]
MSLMCVYQDCLSVKYPCSRIAFFRLPTDDRRSTWIRNSGNKSLLKISEKAQRFFCENHFRECDINNQFNRKLLRRDAVPIEHVSLRDALKPAADETNVHVESNEFGSKFLIKNKSIPLRPIVDTIHHQKIIQKTNTELIECLEDNTDYQSLFEELESSTTVDADEVDTPAEESSSSNPYRLLELYDDASEEPSTTRILVQEEDQESTSTKTNEKQHQGESMEIYLEENSNNNQVDSSTIELEGENGVENIETLDEDEEPTAYVLPTKRKRPNETLEIPPPVPVVMVGTPNSEINKNHSLTTCNNYDTYEEDKHFALSLVGYFQRLPQGKKALAKLKILQYLTELEVDLPTSL